jgi:DNA-directed RNA polymerase specialized sigma24 family protein
MTRLLKFSPRPDWAPSLVIEDRCAPAIFDRIMSEFEPYLKRAAKYIAADYPAVARDLVQAARITLWELDLGRFTQGDAAYLKRMLCTRMTQAYRSECRGGLTTGWSKHVGREQKAAGEGRTAHGYPQPSALVRQPKSPHDC